MKYYPLVFIFLIISCKNRLTPQEFLSYINNVDNGFIKEIKNDSFLFTLQFLPPEYIAIRYVYSGIETDFDMLKNQSDSVLNFKLKVCSIDSTPIDRKSISYKQKISFLNNEFSGSCILITSNDTLHPVLQHFENSPNVKPCENVMFAFENTPKLKPLKIIINAPLYNSTPLEFKINKIKQLKVPQIKL